MCHCHVARDGNWQKCYIIASLVQRKQASGREYKEKICLAIRDRLETRIADFEIVKVFIAKCDDVMMAIFIDDKEVQIFIEFSGTGASLNLI